MGKERHLRTALSQRCPKARCDQAGSALPPRQPLLHDLEESHSETQTAWLTLLWNQGKSLPPMKLSKGSLISPPPAALLHILPAAPSQVLPLSFSLPSGHLLPKALPQ